MKDVDSKVLEISEIERVCQLSITFLGNAMIKADGKMGWHQIVGGSIERVGWVGSAVGLLTITHNMYSRNYIEQIQNQLLQDQFCSSDPLLDGGWSIRIVSEFPVLEGTAWVLSALVKTHCQDQKAIDRAYNWIVNNQNKDGGWGSIANQPSRTYLTCLALRTLYTRYDKFADVVASGIAWLQRTRNVDDGGWGELPGRSSSCFHTADVLYTLRISPLQVDSSVLRTASQYVLELWDPKLMWNQEPLSEQYDIMLSTKKWFRVRNYYFPTAWAVMALLAGDTEQGLLRQEVWRSLSWIIKTQEQRGYWRHPHDYENIYIWGIHDNTLALRFFQNNMLKCNPTLTMQLLGDTIIISNKSTHIKLVILALRIVVSKCLMWLRRNWRALTFVIYCATAAVLLFLKILTWKDVLLGLMIPLILLIWQIALLRKESH